MYNPSNRSVTDVIAVVSPAMSGVLDLDAQVLLTHLLAHLDKSTLASISLACRQLRSVAALAVEQVTLSDGHALKAARIASIDELFVNCKRLSVVVRCPADSKGLSIFLAKISRYAIPPSH